MLTTHSFKNLALLTIFSKIIHIKSKKKLGFEQITSNYHNANIASASFNLPVVTSTSNPKPSKA
jgi:hypothetical protein